jgi:NADP-dependent 3-hydroxy acid dehydrogenase YdfG
VARVLITGCGSGFGKLTALEFGQRGHQVFATCRTAASAEQLAADAYAIEGIQTYALDVTDQAAIDRVIRARHPRNPRPGGGHRRAGEQRRHRASRSA